MPITTVSNLYLKTLTLVILRVQITFNLKIADNLLIYNLSLNTKIHS